MLSIAEIGIALAAVHRRAGASAEPAVAAAQGHFRARPGAGRAVRAGAEPCFIHLALGFSLAASARDRPAAGPVVDRAGAADAALGRRAQHAAGRAGLLDPAVPGPVDRPDDHHHRGDVARAARSRARRRAGRWRSTRSARSSGWCWPGASSSIPLFRLIGRLGERELFVVAGLFAVIASVGADAHARTCRSRWARSSPA